MGKLILSVLVFSHSVFAASVNTLTWKDALTMLQDNNVDYKSAYLNYQSTAILEDSSSSGYWPSLSGNLGYTKTSTTSDGLTETDGFYSASLTASQNLFAGLKDYYKTTQAKANTKIASATFQSAKAKISYDFISAYQNLLSAQENFQLSESTVKRRQGDLRLVELRFESGRENKGSVLLSEAYLAQAKYENLQAKHSLETARTLLSNAIGTQVASDAKLVDIVPISDPIEISDFESIAKQTPEYQKSFYSVDANTAAVGVARSAFFPTLNVTGSVGRNSEEFFPKNERWSVGVSITIPLFDGGRDISSYRSSSYLQQSSVSQNQSVDNSQVSALKLAYQKYVQAVEKTKVDEKFQKALVLQSEIARTQYNNGLMSFTNWDKIESDLIERQKGFVQSKKDRVLSEAAWNQARGIGVLE